jgi:hypothetical protein
VCEFPLTVTSTSTTDLLPALMTSLRGVAVDSPSGRTSGYGIVHMQRRGDPFYARGAW